MRKEHKEYLHAVLRAIMIGAICGIISGVIVTILSSCTPKVDPPPIVTPTPTPIATPPPVLERIPASWESKKPSNKAWSDYTAALVSIELYQDLDTVSDAQIFCPAWSRLTKDQRVFFWVELISQMALYESSWSPVSRMKEDLGIDPVTGVQVWSEGLLQLSYQDMRNHPEIKGCGIDWSKDRYLAGTDPRKTILDPLINLDCGVRILANQVKRTRRIVLSSGIYWSVLKEGGKYRRISEISAGTKKLKFCQEAK